MKIRNIEFQRAQLRWVCLLNAGIETNRQFTMEEHQTVGFGPLRPFHNLPLLPAVISFVRAYRGMLASRRDLQISGVSRADFGWS